MQPMVHPSRGLSERGSGSKTRAHNAPEMCVRMFQRLWRAPTE
jgi:hypothetical protein